jgi:mevalonate kinase
VQPFVTRVGAKWILVGEHSVLRGGAAIAFPCSDFSLELKYEPGPTSLDPGIRRLLDLLGGPNHVSGDLQIRSTIPQGAGLGSSAALSVALTRWAIAQGLVPATTGGDAPLEVTQRDAQIERLATQSAPVSRNIQAILCLL